MLKRLIITADDFGLCAGANLAIRDAHRQGVVNSASLMSNMPGFHEAVEIARACPGLDIGIHMTLAAGRPVSPPETAPSLVGRGGRFLPRRALLVRLLTGRIRGEDLQREVRAQAQKVLETGVRPSHINGDQHVHILPVARDAVLDVARELGIAVRVPAEQLIFRGRAWPLTLPFQTQHVAVKIGLRALARSFRRRCRRLQIPTNDHFVSVFGFLPRRPPATQDLVKLATSLKPGVTELMVHPAIPDQGVADLWGEASLARERDLEFHILTSEEFRASLQRHGTTLATYADLCHPRV